jgi:hypothetical protein
MEPKPCVGKVYMESERATKIRRVTSRLRRQPGTDAMFDSVMRLYSDRLDVNKLFIGTHNDKAPLEAMQIWKKRVFCLI